LIFNDCVEKAILNIFHIGAYEKIEIKL
jgi:hypothetical protein